MAVEAPTAPAATEPTTTIDAPPPGERAPADYMSDVINDFADLDSGKPLIQKEKAKPAEAPKKSTKKQVEKPAAEKVEKPVEKPQETEKPKEEKPAEEKPEGGKSYMRTLGEKYDNLKREVEQKLKPELQTLRSKVQEYETKKPEESTALLAKVKDLEARNTELEKHIEYVDYTKSSDFKAKYQQPYADAWNEAVSEFRELEVTEKHPDGVDDMGEPKFKITTRPATEDDLIALGSLSLSQMDKTAAKMFGESASRAINHIQNLRKLAIAKNKALSEAQTRANEYKTRQEAESKARTDTIAKTWQEVDKTLREKFPRAFDVEEGNEEDKAAHTKGFAYADLVFAGPKALTEEQVESLPESFKNTIKANQPLTETQRVQLHALARLKIANHDRQLVKLRKANERIKELEESLAQYEKSEPESGKGGERQAKGGEGKDWLEQAEDELRAMDK